MTTSVTRPGSTPQRQRKARGKPALPRSQNVEEGAAPWWKKRSVLCPVVLIVLTLACLLPFSSKAFHVDETLFVCAAQQIAKHPLDPYGFQLNWDYTTRSMSDVTQNPPLASYYSAVIGVVFGWSESALHLGFLLPALGVILGTYRLARRFTSWPLLAAIVTLLTPAMLLSASSVMCDVMMLAFWVWGCVFWMNGLEKNKPVLLISAGILLGSMRAHQVLRRRPGPTPIRLLDCPGAPPGEMGMVSLNPPGHAHRV